jgi:cytochrome c oxidase subunit 2
MRKHKFRNAGSTSVAAALSVFLLALTLITVYLFVVKQWWFPPSITKIGDLIDSQFSRTLWITGIVFVLAQLGLAWVVFRYRDTGKRATHSEGNTGMEVVWTLATVILFVGLGAYAEDAWAQVHFAPASANALQVEVTGQQFKWSFRFPGPDGKFGNYKTVETALKERARGDQNASPWQLDPKDANGKDDIVLGPGSVLAVPVNKEVEMLIRSQDVTHSFFVRELRLKQDAVPGMTIRMHFTATKVGKYEIACAELCGQSHYTMRSELLVMSEADFEQWLKTMAANQ